MLPQGGAVEGDRVDNALHKPIIDLCVAIQQQLGNDQAAVCRVMNALLHATAAYAVDSTTHDKKEGQKRFDSLSMKMAVVMQDFLAEHTGGAAIIELPNKP